MQSSRSISAWNRFSFSRRLAALLTSMMRPIGSLLFPYSVVNKRSSDFKTHLPSLSTAVIKVGGSLTTFFPFGSSCSGYIIILLKLISR